jgi:hypothetical protein
MFSTLATKNWKEMRSCKLATSAFERLLELPHRLLGNHSTIVQQTGPILCRILSWAPIRQPIASVDGNYSERQPQSPWSDPWWRVKWWDYSSGFLRDSPRTENTIEIWRVKLCVVLRLLAVRGTLSDSGRRPVCQWRCYICRGMPYSRLMSSRMNFARNEITCRQLGYVRAVFL